MAHHSAGSSSQRGSNAGKHRAVYRGRLHGGIDEVIVKVVIGELDNNLVTNTSIIGKTRAEIAGTTIFLFEFYDYLGNQIIPTGNVIVNESIEQEFEVTDTASDHRIGRVGASGSLYAKWILENNSIRTFGEETQNTSTVAEVNEFSIKSITTEEKTYTKFRYTT